MIKVALLLTTILSGTCAFAKTNFYDVKFDLSLNGKHVSTSQLLVEEGKTGSINLETNGEKTFTEVVATEYEPGSPSAVKMTFNIGTVDINGQRTVIGSPTVITRENEAASIAVGKDGAEELGLAVTVKRR